MLLFSRNMHLLSYFKAKNGFKDLMITLTGNEESAYTDNVLDMEILVKEHFLCTCTCTREPNFKGMVVHASLSHLSICEIRYNRLDLQ